MAPHPSTLSWKIPWAEEPGSLQSTGSLRVRHDWTTSLSLFTFTHWRRKWQPTPVFLLGESQERGSLGGLLSRGSHRVGHDWSDLAAAAVVFLPGEFHRQRNLEDYSPWGHKVRHDWATPKQDLKTYFSELIDQLDKDLRKTRKIWEKPW